MTTPDHLSDNTPEHTLAYATPSRTKSPSVWAAAVIAVVGLGLIALGGCFLIGILTALSNNTFTSGRQFFVGVLYVIAIACFGAATFLLAISIRRLLELARRD